MSNKKVVNYALLDLKLLCEWQNCSKEFTLMIDFINHISQEHLTLLNGDDLHCHWKECEVLPESLPALRRHVFLHSFHTKIKCYGQNIQILQKIPNCTLSSKHRNIVPDLPEPLKCSWEDCTVETECPEYFYRHVDCHVDYHFTFKEDDEEVISCLWNGCNKKLSERSKLKEHLRTHTHEKLIACPTCGGMFSSRTKFFDHIHRQLPVDEDLDNVYVCEYCSRKMNSERLLRDHMRCHVNHYKCPYCDMTCPTPSSVKLHLYYRHSDEKPNACHYCEYRCKTENDLQKHLESHSTAPNYKCTEEGCSFTSRSQSSYKVHCNKMHEGKELPKYSCHLCNKVCTRGNYLTKHLTNHHKFSWPSGHCRFRYKLNDDGFYRLQTVRYESVELNETVMCESSEIIDDPSSFINSSNNVDATSSICTQNNQIDYQNNALDSLMLYLQDNQPPQAAADNFSLPVTNIFEEHSVQEEEPVLINIVDAEGKTSQSGCNVLLIKTARPVPCDQIRSVQLLTKDESGNVVFETAEIITQFNESDGIQQSW